MIFRYTTLFALRISLRSLLLVGCTLIALALAAPSALASYEWLGALHGEFGASGEGVFGGDASGIAVDDASGDVYVANAYTPRVTKFDSEGKFLGALGWNVTATGPDKAGVDQVEELTVRASAGKFKLEYFGSKTGELNFNVSSHEMEEALDGLPNVGGVGGAIKVSGGPGDATGSHPYTLTFEGALGDEQTGSVFPVGEDGLSGGSPTSGAETKSITEGTPAFEDCVLANGDTCRGRNESMGEGVGQFTFPVGIAVDNSCSLHVPVLTEVTSPSCKEFDPFDGDVYVLDGGRQKGVVQVFSSDGAFVTSFGEKTGELVNLAPEKFHNPGSIAVGSSGELYVADGGPLTNDAQEVAESRVMVFKAKGGGYEYAGQSHDIAVGYSLGGLAVDAAGNVYASGSLYANGSHVLMFAAGEPATPACESEKEYYNKHASFAVDPLTGQSFVFTETPEGFHNLGACDAQTKKLVETARFPAIAKQEGAVALAFNPFLRFENDSSRPKGLLYAIAGENTSPRGLIFSQAQVSPPKVASESVSSVGSSYATLDAGVEPFGYDTHYRFQYIGRAAYEANHPDETQTLTVSATGGLSTLGFGGQSTGGTGAITLTAGSGVVTGLLTATGTANLTAGSATVTSLVTGMGRFVVGQSVSGSGIEAGTMILSVAGSTITLSKPAMGSGVGVSISSEGPLPFAAGQTITGAGIPAGTTIRGVEKGTLQLSQAATATSVATTVTSGLPFDASAKEVRTALDGLSSIGGSGGSVSVTGGPGDETGSAPYTVTFEGSLADTNVAQLTSDATALTGGSQSAVVATTNEGGGGFSSGAMEAPVNGGELEGSQGVRAAGVTLTGLAPEASYHFRVLVSNHCNPEEPAEECVGTGPDHAFTTYPATATGLPDGRVYEMVSPPFKAGGDVYSVNRETLQCAECMPGSVSERFPMQASPDGNSVVYEGDAFAASGESPDENEYVARRTPTGWESSDLSPAIEHRNGGRGFQAFSTDLSSGILYLDGAPVGLPEEAPVGYGNLYTRGTGAAAELQPLLTAGSMTAPLKRAPGSLDLKFGGASSDFGHVVLSANDALTAATAFAPAAVDSGTNLYEWVGGTLRLVNVLPENVATVPAAFAGPGGGVSHEVSSDGSRIFWSAGGRVYVRENGESTVEIGDPNGSFLVASGDGHRVLLNDGYLYEEEPGGEYAAVATLTEGQGGFQGILGASENLSKVYFADTAVLSGEEENAQGATAQTGADNMYLWDEGAITYVATISAADGGQTYLQGVSSKMGDLHASPSSRTAEATPDGRFLTFMSNLPLTGYDKTAASGKCIPRAPQNVCSEVFEYDSASKNLVCASCNPTGERPVGDSVLSLIYPGPIPLPQPAHLSTNGRVFFDSTDVLSSRVTNAGVENVYEYEPEGIGSCTRTGGCVFLISSGVGEAPSDFVNATPSGSNVFFTTRSQLVPADQDQLMDLYDARENGGFAPGGVLPPCTNTDSCRVASGPQPAIFGAPSSQTFTGAGNPSPSPSGSSVAPKSLTRVQQLAKALKVCKGKRVKRKRVACEVQARKRYGPKAKAKAKRAARRVVVVGVRGRK